MDAYEVAMNILWDACCQFKEEAYMLVRDGNQNEYDKYDYPEYLDEWTEEDWANFQMKNIGYYLGE